MRIDLTNFNRRRRERKYKRLAWHQWFAWYPVVVTVNGKANLLIWLETVERKFATMDWTIKPKPYYRLTYAKRA